MESVSNLLATHISPSSGDNQLLSLKRLISPLKPTWVISMLLSLLQLAKRGSQFVGGGGSWREDQRGPFSPFIKNDTSRSF